jgi:sensor c-di-GMP phosphodiesterase-like protein
VIKLITWRPILNEQMDKLRNVNRARHMQVGRHFRQVMWLWLCRGSLCSVMCVIFAGLLFPVEELVGDTIWFELGCVLALVV